VTRRRRRPLAPALASLNHLPRPGTKHILSLIAVSSSSPRPRVLTRSVSTSPLQSSTTMKSIRPIGASKAGTWSGRRGNPVVNRLVSLVPNPLLVSEHHLPSRKFTLAPCLHLRLNALSQHGHGDLHWPDFSQAPIRTDGFAVGAVDIRRPLLASSRRCASALTTVWSR
jgi:hypothetical protein